MGFRNIQYKGKVLTIHKAVTQPHFDEKTVLVTDTWDYVDLWLKRKKLAKARFYWGQARSFYDATETLSKTARPLTAYYCFLNATKALLLAKGEKFSDAHGVTGYTAAGKTSLSNEIVKFKTGGILPALCRHLGEPASNTTYSLKDLLYNLAYIHRAFDLTYHSSPELFVPIGDPRIVRSNHTHEAWFIAELTEKYASQNTVNRLPSAFEREQGEQDHYLVRLRHRFSWRPQQKPASLRRYQNYHRRIRRHVHYICGPQRLWYIKRNNNIDGHILRSQMTITFAAMHKLSELSRYAPDALASHFDCQHNWLLSEFLETAPLQFIDEISSEMTGREFMIPGRASR
jgi:hypothetical protein